MSADLATLHAEELLRRDRDIAALRVALRDAQEANDALRRENARLRKIVKLMQTRAEVHALELRRFANGDVECP